MYSDSSGNYFLEHIYPITKFSATTHRYKKLHDIPVTRDLLRQLSEIASGIYIQIKEQ